MFCGYWNVDLIHLMCFSVMLAGVTTEQDRRPSPPTFKINKEENYLKFRASPPNSTSPHCWKYMFQYSKCNEKALNTNVSEDSSWTAKVEYDSACKYTVQAQAIFDTKYCGEIELNSDMSEPMYFGKDGDPNLPFKVAMIIIPVIVCFCLIIAMVLFRRHKDKFFPKVPSPSHFFKDMFDSNKGMTKGLYVRELYVPNEEVVENIQVEPNATNLHHEF